MAERIYRGYRDLKVYQLSYKLALQIHEITKLFPKDFGYLDEVKYRELINRYEEVNKMLNSMIDKADKFAP
jgi:hypothetical protein